MEKDTISVQNFSEVLKLILKKEDDLNEKVPYESFPNGRSYTQEESEKMFYNRRCFIFFTFVGYLDLFPIENVAKDQITSSVEKYQDGVFLNYWLEAAEKLSDEDLGYIVHSIFTLNLSQYRDADNDSLLFDFCVQYYIGGMSALYQYALEDTDERWNADIAILTILKYSPLFNFQTNQLSIHTEGISKRILTYMLANVGKDCIWYFSGIQDAYKGYLMLLGLLYPTFKVIFLDDSEINTPNNVPFKFDFSVIMNKHDNSDIILDHMNIDGFRILQIKDLNKSMIQNIIKTNTLHLLCNYHGINSADKYLLVVQKKQSFQDKIKCLRLNNAYRPFQEDELIETLTARYRDLLLSQTKNYMVYQNLPIEDFMYAENKLSFNFIFREEEELNFKWFKISDIFKEDSELYECNGLIPVNQVFSHRENLDFSFDLPSEYYIQNIDDDSNTFNPSDYHHYLSIIKNNEGNLSYAYDDIKPIYDIFGPDGKCDSIEAKRITQVALQRTLVKPGYLAINSDFYKVDASESTFVNFYRYGISFDEFMRCDGLYDEVIPCQINPQFHDYCVMYQMHKHNKELKDEAVLLPATKELQEKYYYQKQYEFFKENPQEIIKHEQRKRKKHIPQCNIKSIGFSNFRKFQLLPLLDIKDVTMFVGGNNSGKSTVVKGLLLALDNLKTMVVDEKSIFKTPLFRFYAKGVHDTNIAIFERALYNKAEDETIKFNIDLSEFIILLYITGDLKKTQTSAPVTRVDIFAKNEDMSFTFDLVNNVKSITSHNISYESEMSQSLDLENQNIFSTYIKSFLEGKEVENDKTGLLAANYLKIIELSNEFDYISKSISIEYISAHAANQNILYNTADKNDYMARTILDFVSLDIENDSEVIEFFKTWMPKLGIGVDFKLKNIAGEAFTLQICNEDGTVQYLADKGIGSNQLMILLLKIATIVRKYSHTKVKPIIVIEEPEQNLHPALQSKLTDFFFEISTKYKIKFIVETHSEYLIRRSQVIVSHQHYSEEELIHNPFIVYYFPESDLPYDMKYTTSGRFEEQFGEGFFDAASKLNLQLPRIERRR